MTEYFDNFLSVDHLFDITIYITKSFLLTYKIITTLSGNTACHLKHDKYKAEYKNGKLPACEKHGKKHRNNCDQRGEHLRDTLCKHLTQRVRIVGIMAHNIAMCMRIKITDRQCLHMFEHLVSNTF